MSIWSKIWTAWAIGLIVLIVTFLIVEGIALKRPEVGDTLSESVWALRDAGRWVYWLIVDAVLVMGVTCGWLLYHFRFAVGRAP